MKSKHISFKRTVSVLLTLCLTLSIFVGMSLPASAATSSISATTTDGSTFRTGFLFQINNVTSVGASKTWSENSNPGVTQVAVSGPVYLKTYQTASTYGVGCSTAVLEVDRSLYSDIRSTGIQIMLKPTVHTRTGGVRWGIELFPYSTSYTTGSLGNSWNSTTVTDSAGVSRTYTLCNSSGTTMASAETSGGDFTQDASTSKSVDITHGPYYWYLKGAAPAVGQTAVLRVVAICCVRQGDNNYQMLSEWTDVTIKGVCKHSNGYTSTSTDASHLKSAATCTSAAVYYKSCTTCGANGTATFTSGNALGHSYTGAYVNQSSGKHYKKCVRFSACGTYGIGTTANSTENCSGGTATCTAQPVCSSCSTAYGSSLGHSWNYSGATFNWSGYTCPNATVKCTRDTSHSTTVNTTVTSAVTTAATCKDTGVRTYTASFTAGGSSYTGQKTETIAKNTSNHAGGTELRNVKAATCTAKGYTGDTYCMGCGAKLSSGSETEMIAHNYSAQTATNDYLKSAATCLSPAVYYKSCSVCGQKGTDTFTSGSKLSHSYTGAVLSNGAGKHSFKCVNGCNSYGGTVDCDYNNVVTAPTCTAKGYTTHTCKVCGYSFNDTETAANGHDFSVYVEEVTPATCEVNATATYKCKNCDETTEKEVSGSMLEHDYSGEVKSFENGFHQKKCVNGCGQYGPEEACSYREEVTAPTCTEWGYTTHTCSVCWYSFDDTRTEPTGHHFTEYVEEIIPATCLENATAAYKCADCDETTVKEVPDTMLSHSYTGEVRSNEDGTHAKKCVNGCGAFGPAEACDYKDEITAPTCTEKGYTTHTCKVCGYSYTDTETAAAGHHFTEYVEEVTPATCLENATATYKCADCDETTVKAVPDTALSHSYTGEARSNEDGTHAKKCVNGCDQYGPAVACEYKDEITAPTCTEKGYTSHTCKVCGYSYTDTETAATGHHFTVFTETVSAGTCVNNRVDRFKCADCDETEDREIPDTKDPENHVGEEKTENRNVMNATCVTEGSYDSYTVCASCGQDKGFVHVEGMLDPTNHVGETRTEIEDVVPGTCAAEKTWNEVVYCVDCGEPISSTPKTGEKDPDNHVGETYTKEVNVVPGTCAAPRTWEEVICCAGCDTAFSRTAKTGEKDPENHTGETYTKDENVVPGTCAASKTWEEVTYCAGCDAEFARAAKTGEKDPENHAGETYTKEENIVPGTCAAPKTWEEVTYCADCDAEISLVTKTGEKDPENHTGRTEKKIEDLKAATCVAKESWNEVVYCADCGVKLSTTAAEGGLNPNNHAGPMEVRDRVEATAEEDGYSGDTYCAACGAMAKAGETVRRTKGLCKYCGGYHEGVWGSVVTAVHGVLWLLRRFFNGSLFGR